MSAPLKRYKGFNQDGTTYMRGLFVYVNKNGRSAPGEYLDSLRETGELEYKIDVSNTIDWLLSNDWAVLMKRREKLVPEVGKIWALTPYQERLYGIFDGRGNFVVMHCVRKKKKKAHIPDLELAKKRYKDYLRRLK